jgi:hypothetical protein
VRKLRFDLFAFAARLLERRRIGERTETVAHILIDISRDLARNRRRAFWFQRANRAVVLVGPIVDDVALIDIAGAGEFRSAWANVNVTLPVEDKVGPAEGARNAPTCPTQERAA